jgi:uncharacterized membrane protein (DUF4010 family)
MDTSFYGIIAAAVGGLAIGVERQWSGKASGPAARFAGVRTFTLLGATGGMSGWLWGQQFEAFAIVIVAAAAALVVVAYIAASRTDIDGTTEVSALVVIGAGLVAGVGQIVLASAIVALTGLLLVEKSRLHALVARLDDDELRAAARFAVMAVVVLPLLPEGPYGPGSGVRPRSLWMLVLFFSGLSFAGHAARRAVGSRFGYPLAGLLGGLVSSTHVTLSFSRASRQVERARLALAYGVVGASTVLNVRVAAATAALSPALLSAVWPHLVAPFVVGCLVLSIGARHIHAESDAVEPTKNPLQVREAVQMAILFQIVLAGVDLMRRFWGDSGVIASGAILGLTDMDALTISMARGASSGIPLEVAARAVAVGLLANTLLKMSVTLAVGRARFRRLAGVSLAAMALSIGVSIAWFAD